MAEQEGTGGFVRVFLPGFVLGIVIGAATTFAFFTYNEQSTLPKNSTATPPSNSASTPREIGESISQDPSEQDDAGKDTGEQGSGDDQTPPPDDG